MSRRVAVAFSNMVNPGWPAGGQYLYNLLCALKSCGINIEAVLRVIPGTPSENFGMLNGLIERVFEYPPPVPAWAERLPREVRRRLSLTLHPEERALRRSKIDAQFLFLEPGNARHVPSATWLTDFQHLHFPEFFTREELEDRAHLFSAAAHRSKLVVLSSQDAFDDFRLMAPDAVHKARILSFVAQVPASVYQVDLGDVVGRYHLPDRFFFLPNQFWRHKNHQAVIQAVEIARTQANDVTVVCSGGTNDYRNPSYFDVLLNDIATRNLHDNIRLLGFIPREHLLPLMRQSLAVLQPSLFEGWSTSVEEAKSLGKQVILSDIPVHREQDPPSGLYFSPTSPSELARLLLRLHNEKQPGPDLPLEQSAKENLRDRTETFARSFYEIISEMIAA